ncbi:MAG: flagellar basal body L-ring protein FlgH [Armatimonadetes bacterium]|nr:flagellar basal body L-ring protein FlgH [Armatimonadota bacterium]
MERLIFALTLFCSVVTATTVKNLDQPTPAGSGKTATTATPRATVAPTNTGSQDPAAAISLAEPRRSDSTGTVAQPSVGEPLVPATPRPVGRESYGIAPVANPRYDMPTTPAVAVGYAPQAAGPLPTYPGLGGPTMPLTGNPAQTIGAGPLVRLFTDIKASGPGDTVTIIITQQAVAAANAAKSSNRDTSGTFNAGTGLLSFLPAFSFGWKGGNTGKSDESGNFSINTTFTAMVAAVLPNGNLQLEGQQQVLMDGKPQWVKLTGECRPYDITADNTIASTKVANVKIEWNGLRGKTGTGKGLFDVIGGAIKSLFGWLF